MNKSRKTLRFPMQLCSIGLIALLVMASAHAETPAPAQEKDDRIDTRSALAVASRFRLSFVDSGRMPKSSTPTITVKRSSTAPDSVAGMIKTTLGGIKFPDGSVQPAQAGGPTLGGEPLLIVTHDTTLQGDGTKGSPLGIKAPLILSGSLTVGGLISASPATENAIEAIGGTDARGDGQIGVTATGGKSDSKQSIGGAGVVAQGGDSAGTGVVAVGGPSEDFNGGVGVRAAGGDTISGFGGKGLVATGGFSSTGRGGIGIEVVGGGAQIGDGGLALDITGGSGSGNNHIAGGGILVRLGTAFNGAGKGIAGDFIGDVQIEQGNLRVTGNLSKGGGSFKIDHPLDPANKYLYHSFVESPDMMNIYNGTVTTDGNGDALVELPGYFGALNRDFRYQLTVIGTFAQAIVAEKVKDNHFRIRTNSPNVEVSWQVTGIRQDAYANKNRIPVEQDKPEQERGFFLHPDAFDQPEDKSILVVQHPGIARQMKEAGEKSQKEKVQ